MRTGAGQPLAIRYPAVMRIPAERRMFPADQAPSDIADRHGLPHLERFALYLVWHHKADWHAIERHVNRFRQNPRETAKLRRVLKDAGEMGGDN